MQTLLFLFLSRKNKCFLILLFVVPAISKRDKVGFSLLSRFPFSEASVTYKLNPIWERFLGGKILNAGCPRRTGKGRTLDFEFSVASMGVSMEEENSLGRGVVNAHLLSNLAQYQFT